MQTLKKPKLITKPGSPVGFQPNVPPTIFRPSAEPQLGSGVGCNYSAEVCLEPSSLPAARNYCRAGHGTQFWPMGLEESLLGPRLSREEPPPRLQGTLLSKVRLAAREARTTQQSWKSVTWSQTSEPGRNLLPPASRCVSCRPVLFDPGLLHVTCSASHPSRRQWWGSPWPGAAKEKCVPTRGRRSL